MSIFLLRTFAYLVLPLLLATFAIALDKQAQTRERRIEVFLIYMFALGAAAGFGNFAGHIFASDAVAEAIGWEAGSPFQLEMGFANLAFGVLAIIAMGRRDGFREATVIGSAILAVGATLVHLWDVVQTGNLAPGNTLQNIVNLGRPAILIYLLIASRRAEALAGSESDTAAFDRWRGTHLAMAGPSAGAVAFGMGVGMAIDQALLGFVVGLAGGLAIGLYSRARALQDMRQAGQPPA